MNENTLSEIKNQLWAHLDDLHGQIKKYGVSTVAYDNRENFVDQGGVRRSRWWLVDQLFFCRSEITYWRGVESSESKLKSEGK